MCWLALSQWTCTLGKYSRHRKVEHEGGWALRCTCVMRWPGLPLWTSALGKCSRHTKVEHEGGWERVLRCACVMCWPVLPQWTSAFGKCRRHRMVERECWDVSVLCVDQGYPNELLPLESVADIHKGWVWGRVLRCVCVVCWPGLPQWTSAFDGGRCPLHAHLPGLHPRAVGAAADRETGQMGSL